MPTPAEVAAACRECKAACKKCIDACNSMDGQMSESEMQDCMECSDACDTCKAACKMTSNQKQSSMPMSGSSMSASRRAELLGQTHLGQAALS